MTKDRIIAVSDIVSRDVSTPLVLGCLRPSETTVRWEDDVLTAFHRNERAILSGDLRDLDSISAQLNSLRKDFPYARCGLLFHWKQALAQISAEKHLNTFDIVHVAIDETIDPIFLKTIQAHWKCHWVLIPCRGFFWRKWIASTLFPEKSGALRILVPNDEQVDILSVDEIRILISELSLEHPLIHVHPAPPEWFVPSELGPWLQSERRAITPKTIHDSRTQSNYTHSVIIPFLWTGEPESLARLHVCLQSITDTLQKSREIILAIDRTQGARELCKEDFPQLSECMALDLERMSSLEDWRAGFVRNFGAEFSRNQAGHFIFVDADVAIRGKSEFLEALSSDFDLLQTCAPNQTGFESASSSLIVVQATLFRNLGGFAEAFHHYGCEDNYLVWQIEKAKKQIHQTDRSIFEHLRPIDAQDDVAAKMARIRPSASLMYRMTLDPRVHHHFYSSLGSSVWSRALVKHLYAISLTRWVFALLVFFATFFETENRTRYLASFYDVAIWKLKHPLLWLKSRSWKAQIPWHFMRRNAWRISHALLSVPRTIRSVWGHIKVAAEIGFIKARESRWGWNIIGWRILRIRALWDHFKWRPAVWWQRLIGNWRRLLGFFERIFVVYLIVPTRNIISSPGSIYHSQVLKFETFRTRILSDLQQNEPSTQTSRAFRKTVVWLFENVPRFFQQARYWIFLKPIYFLRYHLIQRWRKT